jgi:hypothetical protein
MKTNRTEVATVMQVLAMVTGGVLMMSPPAYAQSRSTSRAASPSPQAQKLATDVQAVIKHHARQEITTTTRETLNRPMHVAKHRSD